MAASAVAHASGTSPAASWLPAPGSSVGGGLASLVGDEQRTRFTAALAGHVELSVFTLADPYRVIIDLPQVGFHLPDGLENKGHGLIKSFRTGTYARSKTRIVLNVTGPVVIEKSYVTKPKAGQIAQLVVELVPTDRATFMAGQSRQLLTSAASSPGPFRLGARVPRPPKADAPAARLPTIVIDPGHGGHDSGATKNGTVEKEVVLAFGLMLREKLEATGRYRVLMTRDTDRFVELDERRDYALRHKADLFLAIHADYVPSRRDVRGATIYTLRESVAKSLSKSGKRWDDGDLLTSIELDEASPPVEESPDVLKSILKDLASRAQKPTQTRTNFFAKSVIDYMGQTTELKDEPHREASFRVLKSSQVPSVLIELAYVSNRQDAANLKSNEWRDRVSSSILAAINRYFNVTRLPL